MTALYDGPWLREQLARSQELLEGAWGALPEAHRAILPPGRLAKLSQWPAQLHLYHLYIYERHTADYSRYWLGSTQLSEAEEQENERLWHGQEEDWRAMSGAATLAGMQEERRRLLANLAQVHDWDARHDVFWGKQNLRWIAAKGLQHTLEHTNTLMQLAIFWDRA